MVTILIGNIFAQYLFEFFVYVFRWIVFFCLKLTHDAVDYVMGYVYVFSLITRIHRHLYVRLVMSAQVILNSYRCMLIDRYIQGVELVWPCVLI